MWKQIAIQSKSSQVHKLYFQEQKWAWTSDPAPAPAYPAPRPNPEAGLLTRCWTAATARRTSWPFPSSGWSPRAQVRAAIAEHRQSTSQVHLQLNRGRPEIGPGPCVPSGTRLTSPIPWAARNWHSIPCPCHPGKTGISIWWGTSAWHRRGSSIGEIPSGNVNNNSDVNLGQIPFIWGVSLQKDLYPFSVDFQWRASFNSSFEKLNSLILKDQGCS